MKFVSHFAPANHVQICKEEVACFFQASETHTHKEASKQTSKQARKQASKQASTHARTQARKHASTHARTQASTQARKPASQPASEKPNNQTRKQTTKQTNGNQAQFSHAMVFLCYAKKYNPMLSSSPFVLQTSDDASAFIAARIDCKSLQ